MIRAAAFSLPLQDDLTLEPYMCLNECDGVELFLPSVGTYTCLCVCVRSVVQEAKEKRQEKIAKRRRLSSLRASQSKSESSQK